MSDMRNTIELPPFDQRPHDVPPPPPPPPAPAKPGRSGAGRTVAVAAIVAAVVSASVTAPLTGAIISRSEPEAPSQPAAAEVEPAEVADSQTTTTDAAGANVVAEVAEAVSPSVVFIAVGGFGNSGSGSGVILRSDGYILTNNHVVDNASSVEVTLPDAGVVQAGVVGTDPSSDVAVIKVDQTGLPVPEFASTTPRVGDLTVAIGSPFGLEGSVTSGIVSAVNRSLGDEGGGSALLIDLIQTDAAINPGNSGGALANADAEIIGINTAIISPSQASAGIGFAIPIQSALPIAEQIIEQGYAEHAQLGIQGENVDPRVADLYGLPVDRGALIVAVVPGSAADEAGLTRGDIVTAIDGEPVESMAELAGRIRSYAPGDSATLTVFHDNEERSVDVTFGAAPRQ